jgi:hypothetical protein
MIAWICPCGYMNNTVICTKCGRPSVIGKSTEPPFTYRRAFANLDGKTFTWAQLRDVVNDVRVKHMNDLPPDCTTDELVDILGGHRLGWLHSVEAVTVRIPAEEKKP